MLLFSAGNMDDLVASAYPILQICITATASSTAGSLMTGGLLLINVVVGIGSVAFASGLTRAWSRGGTLLAYFAHVDPKRRISVRSVWLPTCIAMVLSLLNMGSHTAFSVFVALSTLGLYQSYLVAIGCMVYARWRGGVENVGWSLGRWGIAINVVAMIYSAHTIVFLAFPFGLPVNAATMNYALPINAAVFIIALGLWFGWAKDNWKGESEEVVGVEAEF